MKFDKLKNITIVSSNEVAVYAGLFDYSGTVKREVCATELMSIDQLVDLRDYFNNKIEERLGTDSND